MIHFTKLFGMAAIIATVSFAAEAKQSFPSSQLNCYITGNSRATIVFTDTAEANGQTYHVATLSETASGRTRSGLNVVISEDLSEITDDFRPDGIESAPSKKIVLRKNEMLSSPDSIAYTGFVSLEGTYPLQSTLLRYF